MDLFKAVLLTGVVAENQIENLSVISLNNSANRTFSSATSRFLIKYNNEPICSVKKIPRNNVFNLELMIDFQQRLALENEIAAPKVYGYYQDDIHVYIVEEYIAGKTLEECILDETLGAGEATDVIKKLFNSLYDLSTNTEMIVNNRFVNEFADFLAELSFETHEVEKLKNDFQIHLNSMIGNPVYTSGDIVLKNIIIQEQKVYLIDFDLTNITNMLWIDLLRLLHYANADGIRLSISEFNDIFPQNVDASFLKIVFLLHEMKVQSLILEDVYYHEVRDHLKNLILNTANEFYGNISQIKSSNHAEKLFDLPIPPADFIQLYWTNGSDNLYDEEKSVIKPVTTLDDWNQYNFEIASAPITGLRIDPLNHEGLVEIRSIHIIDQETGTNKEIIHEDLIIGNQLQKFEYKGSMILVSTGDDPQITVKSGIHSAPICLEITMRVLRDFRKLFEEEIHIHAARNQELESIIQEMKTTIDVMEQTSKEQKLHIQGLNQELELLHQELNSVVNSRSWKATRLLRECGNFLRRVKRKFKSSVKLLLGERRVDLVPIHHIASGEGSMWHSTGDDPQFEWVKPIKDGWLRITYAGKAEKKVNIKLYYDDGGGMNPESFVTIGTLDETETIHHAFIRLPSEIVRLRLDPGEVSQVFSIKNIKVRKVSRLEMMLLPVYRYVKNNGLKMSTIRSILIKSIRIVRNEGIKSLLNRAEGMAVPQAGNSILEYDAFLKAEINAHDSLATIIEVTSSFKYKPLISILVPVYNVEEKWLRSCVDSVRKQAYHNWELCLVDDCSTKPHIKKVLNEISTSDNRIRVAFREENGHISKTSNDALSMANGEFVALLDHDDELTYDALYENIKLLNEHPDADVIYSDEDKISTTGERHSPFFKPDWSPDMLMSQMYTCHLSVYRKSIVQEVGGFRVGYEGSQDFDLMLRVSEKTNKIYHIPKILYHWRTIPTSTAMNSSSKNYTHLAGLRALEDTIKRRGLDARVESIDGYSNVFLVRYNASRNPKISIIIPTRDMTSTLSSCLNSIFEKTAYMNFEVIIIDNGSEDPSILELYTYWRNREPDRFKVIEYNIPFNYSKLNNFGVQKSSGELILLLNNDVEVITPDWLDEMAGQAIRSNVGAVGACLYYPDNTLQHGGVITGLGGIAGHSHKHFSADQPGYFCRLKVVSNYSAVTAACLMIKKKTYEEVGGLEEELQVAFNDVDFCLKVKEKGYNNVWLPHVKCKYSVNPLKNHGAYYETVCVEGKGRYL